MIERLDPDIRSLLPAFLDGGQDRMRQLREAVRQEDFVTLRRLGHGLKGTGAMYELDAFHVVGRQIELAAEAHDGATITALTLELEGLLVALSDAVKAGAAR